MALLQYGDSGPDVGVVQQRLIDLGYFVGAVDNDFGPKTAAAVAYLQSTHGLDIDAIVGDQVREILDIGSSVSMYVDARWPEGLDVWRAGDEFVVQVEALDGTQAMDVRVVAWFRGPGGEHHTEETVSVSAGSVALARLTVPSEIATHEGEVHWTGYVFDMTGNELSDEGAGSFRIDHPDAI